MHCVTFSMKNIAPQRLFNFFWQISQTLPFSFWHSCPASSFSSPLPPHPRRPRPPPSEGAVGKLISNRMLSLPSLLLSLSSFCCHCQFCCCRGHQNVGVIFIFVVIVVTITNILGPDTNRAGRLCRCISS